MTASNPRISVTSAYVDITVATPALASVDIAIQNLDDDIVDVFFGGATAPVGGGGIILDTYDSVQGNAANIWVRGSGHIGATAL